MPFFERFASALKFILMDFFKVKYVIKYLDDFLFIGETEAECLHGLNSFMQLCHRLNLPLAEEKTVYPSRQVVFLGIHLNAQTQEASIPLDKAEKYARSIDETLKEKSVSLSHIREISGKLEHVTAIIKGGRAFLRRLHSSKLGEQRASRKIRLSSALKEDMKLWAHFLNTYNSKLCSLW